MLAAVIRGVLCGLTNLSAIVQWLHAQPPQFWHLFGFEWAPASETTFRALLTQVDPRAFEQPLRGWLPVDQSARTSWSLGRRQASVRPARPAGSGAACGQRLGSSNRLRAASATHRRPRRPAHGPATVDAPARPLGNRVLVLLCPRCHAGRRPQPGLDGPRPAEPGPRPEHRDRDCSADRRPQYRGHAPQTPVPPHRPAQTPAPTRIHVYLVRTTVKP